MTRIALVVAAVWLLGGCTSSAVRLMPTPTLFTSADPGLAVAAPDGTWRGARVRVREA